jgi:regulator of protease activity HflC (stomatin/prohibitin superfamily)
VDIFIAVVVIAAVALALGVRAWRRLVDLVTVYEFQRGLRYDRGRFTGVVEPGQYRILRRRTRISALDVRPRVVTVPGQEVISSDGVSIRVSLHAEYELADPVVAINENADYSATFYASLQTALRDAIAGKEIDDILEQRAEIGAALADATRDDAARLGLTLRSVELKDLMFPGELKRTFAQVVSARKEGLAALERARGETAALRNLANAARTMESNPALMQLRILQEIGKTSGNTVVLGLPSATTPLPLRSSDALGELDAPDAPGDE